MIQLSQSEYPDEFLEKLQSVKNKRARVVIDHILQYGSISTAELKEPYGYNHPPRAAKDVRDEGIPLITFTIKDVDGRSIAAYKFGEPSALIIGRSGGRRSCSKRFKKLLYEACSGKCAICNGKFELRELQIDHRIPFEVAGETERPEENQGVFMLVCGSCNRAKSWSCEHCSNWTMKDVSVCQTCYWATPENYNHVAGKEVRRTEIIWEKEDVTVHDKLRSSADEKRVSIQDYVKGLLRNITFLLLLMTVLVIFIFSSLN